jgi:transposase
VDQKGVLVTHKVWPGNRTDAKSLKPMDRCLKNEFGLEAPRVVDRGMATWENLTYMDRKKERYLVALRAKIKSTQFLEEIKKPRDEWMNTGNNEVATSIIKGRRKYVVAWNASVAQTNKKGRESRISKAEDELRLVLESVEKGEIKSRKERDEKVGHIKKKYKVTRYLSMKGRRSGFAFTIERTKTLERLKAVHIAVGKQGGVQVYRKLSGLNKETRTLIEVFGMAENKILPEVDTEKFK